jgi:hypothetical protein
MSLAQIHPVPSSLARRSLADRGTALRAWGWPGALGLACLVAAAGLAGLATPALRQQASAAQDAAKAAEKRAARLSARAADAAVALPAHARFSAEFPSAEHRQERLAALLEHAAARGLVSRRTEFQLNPEPGLGLTRYRMAMPLSGAYANLRDFIDAAQQADPALSLDALRLRRASAATSVIEADLTWSFYMQAETTAEPVAGKSAAGGSPTSPASAGRPGPLR